MTNEPNFEISKITLTSYILKTNASRLKSVAQENEPKRTQFP